MVTKWGVPDTWDTTFLEGEEFKKKFRGTSYDLPNLPLNKSRTLRSLFQGFFSFYLNYPWAEHGICIRL